jgi:hypothetical protein
MQLDDHDAPDDVLSGEAATDLRALSAMADADPNVLPDPDAPVEPIRPPLSDEIAGALLMLSKMAAPMFPSLGLIYTPEACQAVGAAVQPVCEKYGWLQDGIGGEYGPEIMCVCVVGPMAFATYAAVKNDNAARQAKAERKPDGQPAKEVPPPGTLRAPGSDTVTFGAPVNENQ